MAFQTIWHFTDIPDKIIDIIEEDLEKFDNKLAPSHLSGGVIRESKRKSQNTWIPTSHWLGGFIWHYIMRANRENFLYDLKCIDGEAIQYTRYEEGEYYGWHIDQGISSFYNPHNGGNIGSTLENDNNRISEATNDHLMESVELVRKLSFIVQLSGPDDYEGGNVQLMDDGHASGRSYICPRRKGTIILFDSRTSHRVCKVTKGVRKSLVGWAIGPRWR